MLGNDEPDFENNEENSYHVVTGSSTDASAVHDGFTITRGNANTESGPNRFGGGMYSNGGSPTVMNCIFSGNRAQFGGGMLNDNSSPMVNNCTFSGNRAQFGGGMYSNGGAPVITHCAFIANSAVGKFADGGGMLNFQGSNSAVAYCTFRGNTADERGGGMYNYNSSPTVDHCTFNGNTAFWGGGMFNSQRSNSMVTNCTIAGNSAAATGGIGTGNSTPTVRNCVVWGNNPEQWPQIGGGAMVTYSDVQGGWSGAGSNNIDADPLFVDADGPDDDPDTWEDNDYRLAAGSPCIDAADNTAVPEGIVTDLDGNPRFVDDPNTDDTGVGDPPIVDMGPYEFGDPCADDDGDGRVTICHIPPGNPDNAHTITVSMNAVPAHLAHGDYCGPCEGGLSADLEAGMILGVQGEKDTRESVAPVLRKRGP